MDSPHPPVFACVMRRSGSPKQLECHGFICSSAEDAIIIAANILPFITAIVNMLAVCDDHISKSESCVIKTLLFIQSCLPLVSFGVTIWVE